MDEEKELDAMIEQIALAVERDENKTSMASPIRYQQLAFTEKVLEYLAKGKGYVVSSTVNSPYKSMGSVKIEGKNLSFDQPEWFCRAAEFASNMEVLPLTNGNVRITFTFHGLTVPIE